MKRLFCFALAATLAGICACSREKDPPKPVIDNPQAQEKDPPKPPERISDGEKDAKNDDAKKEGIVWSMDYVDKTWGIKVKSVQVNKIKNKGEDSESPERSASLLCEFSKDLPVEAVVVADMLTFPVLWER